MQPVKQNAIVLGGVDYGDTSRVVWVLTPEFGRQSLMVKGARRPKSRFQGCLETFSLVELIYRKGARGSMPTLREADVREQWDGLRGSLDAFLASSEAVEMVKAVCSEDQESAETFDLLVDFLVFCDSRGREARDLRLALLSFRWRLASLLGVAPQLVSCVRCSRDLNRIPRYRFLVSEGGLLCRECDSSAVAAPGSTGQEIDYDGLRFVYRSLRRFPSPGDELPDLSEHALTDLERLTRRYLSYHLGEHRAFKGGGADAGGKAGARQETMNGEIE